MPDIDTLIPDICKMLADGKADLDGQRLAQCAASIGKGFRKQVMPDDRGPRPEKVLYASELGKPCKRELWYKIHHPELAGKLRGEARVKFMYGDMIEHMMLWLTREAGHTVTHEQHAIEMWLGEGWKVRGRIDAVIDGVLVDVKSVAPNSMGKFKTGLNDSNDMFGYRAQLGVYDHALRADGVIPVGAPAPAFFAIDKSSGELVMSKQGALPSPESYVKLDDLEKLSDNKHCGFTRLTPNAKTGAIQTGCRYCSFINVCWPKLKVLMVGGKQVPISGE